MLCRAIPYEGREPYIFFSYSHKDSERVYPLLEQMVRDGYRVWYDDGNHPGDDWLENIGQHLNNCNLCLAMMSQNSEESHNCKKEVSFAVQCNKKLMAVMLEQFAMTVGMRLQLSTIHYLVKTEYPSDKALLEKLYETESMRACRAAPGSLKMRTIATEAPQKTSTKVDMPALQNFVNSEVISQASVQSSEDASEPEKTSTETKTKAKTLKIKTKAKVVKAVKKAPNPDTKAVVEQDQSADHEESVAEGVQQETAMPSSTAAVSETEKITAVPLQDAVQDNGNSIEAEQKTNPSIVEPEAGMGQKKPEPQSISNASKVLLVKLADGNSYVSDKTFIRIGRSEKRCDMVLSNYLVSNHHANIIVENGVCYLQDAGSSNGTFINGERLQPNSSVELTNAAKFQICKEELMLFYGEEVAECAARKSVAYLCNPETKRVRILTSAPFLLDRLHKWDDGSLSNGNISRKHARICCGEDGYYLEDLGSKNGTYYNENKMNPKAKQKLENGDRIRLVDTVLEFNSVTF